MSDLWVRSSKISAPHIPLPQPPLPEGEGEREFEGSALNPWNNQHTIAVCFFNAVHGMLGEQRPIQIQATDRGPSLLNLQDICRILQKTGHISVFSTRIANESAAYDADSDNLPVCLILSLYWKLVICMCNEGHRRAYHIRACLQKIGLRDAPCGYQNYRRIVMDVEKRRKELMGLLGNLPPLERKVSAQLIESRDMGGWVLETLLLDLNGIESVPAYLARPSEPGEYPAVLYNHYHGGEYAMGKREFVENNTYLHSPYAPVLAQRGYVALCIDHLNFGQRRGRKESELFKEMIWRGQVPWGMMVYDSIKALDYLCARPEVDDQRVGTLGLSMGSTMAWWLAALDTRVQACVDICCMTDFDALIEANGLDEHGIYYYVPGLLCHFTTAEINSLICPRWHLSLNGLYDRLTPVKGLDRIDRRLKAAYSEAGVPERWRMVREACGHMETAYMRKEILAFLDDVLKK